ncbi:MAG: BamA/TamA family outer membrane protein, partial [Candidatus Omnitrophica bacterium]|nr:BamA/TamA family outer membrane protein [Candidatus Omnitrophota bacterium]
LKGYVTSRAYIPPQSLSNGRLIIKVVEGKLGELDIRGNQHFKSDLLRNYVDLEPQGYFDYSALQRALVYINEHPDRTARIILVPGKVPGTTDLVLDVEDRLPIHVGFEYDNFASRYLKENRFALTLEHNNLFGFDDRLFLKGQLSEDTLLELYQIRYVFPINKTWDVGFYVLNVDTELGKEFKSLKAEGDAFLAGIFASKQLLYRDDLELRLNIGFDYKDIENHLLGVKTSEDNLRVFKIGLDVDANDRWGRNIFTTEFDFGLDDFLGASDAKDPMASRLGAGGKFHKWMFHFFRLQPMPYESYILWKNSAQISNHNLAASEQFQIGGPTSVRAYAPAEYSGDRGIYSSIEWSFPLYFLPDDWKVPYREETWYESLKWVIFYDIGFVDVKNPLPGEETTETLKGYGTGIRMNVKDDIEIRVEAAWPIGDRSEDGNRTHLWFEFRIKF